MGKIVGFVIKPETDEKDIEKMTVAELTAYAGEKNIGIEGLTKKADILAKIKEVEGGEQ